VEVERSYLVLNLSSFSDVLGILKVHLFFSFAYKEKLLEVLN
jgi:hypothetical protein